MSLAIAEAGLLTPAWKPLRYHKEQDRLWHSKARFKVVPAGRRSGKTEIEGKRKTVREALSYTATDDGLFVCAAPTHQQAKRIYWKDLKKLVPRWAISGRISESELTIPLINGAEVVVAGLDKPSRIEGRPINRIVLDEVDDMREDVWEEHIRPALSTPGRPLGTASFIGVPEGRSRLYRLMLKAQADKLGEWDGFHWISADILDASEIQAAKDELDERTYRQEYEASFETFTGRTYHAFKREVHAVTPLKYNPRFTLIFCFDFNISPGVACVVQEQDYNGKSPAINKRVTGVIGEVWIPYNSTTVMVCRKLIQDWGDHPGRVVCYGDATGGAGGSAKVEGSDWELIKKTLGKKFEGRIDYKVPKANPRERVRVNAVNSRLTSASGKVSLLVDPSKAPHTVLDLDGVTMNELGEIDKKRDKSLTHITDALGYYVVKEFPVRSGRRASVTQL